jgi:hypothetical protein
MFNTSITDGRFILFVAVSSPQFYDGYRGVLDIKLSGAGLMKNPLEVNKAMSELLVRRARISDFYYQQVSDQTCAIAANRLICVAQELINEGNFDLLFW